MDRDHRSGRIERAGLTAKRCHHATSTLEPLSLRFHNGQKPGDECVPKMEAEAERELIERAQAGDRLAYQSMFKIFRPRVFRVVNYILKDEADTEDVVQEIFLKLFKVLGTFRYESSFFTWMYRIAVNTAHARLTSRAREARFCSDSSSQVLETAFSSEGDQPEIAHVRAELAHLLEIAISNLPSYLREAFLLREIDGLSYAEIAELMQCPIGTVKSRVSRAKSFLAERLAVPEEPRH